MERRRETIYDYFTHPSEDEGWDSLEEFHEFDFLDDYNETNKRASAEHKPESTPTNEDYVFANYIGSIYNSIDNCCFDGDNNSERGNRDAYVISMSLMHIMPEEDQESFIEARTKNEKPDNEIIMRACTALTKMLEKSGVMEQVREGDPFFRKLRSASIQKNGYYAIPANVIPEDKKDACDVVELLWKLDDRFFYSEEAKDALYSKQRIRNEYNISEKISQGATEEEIKAEEDKIFHELAYIAYNTSVSVEELLRDPFLREKHCEHITDGRNNVLAKIWQRDEGFYDSFVYRDFVERTYRKFSDVFDRKDWSENTRIIQEKIEKIPVSNIKRIIREYQTDERRGDEMLLDVLAPILGIEHDKPTITYEEPEDDEDGYFSASRNVINLSTTDKDLRMQRSLLRKISNAIRSRSLDENILQRINIIAHEAWHAYQSNGNVEDSKLKDQYDLNFTYYASASKDGYAKYRKQLVEHEAFTFGNEVESLIRKIYGE